LRPDAPLIIEFKILIKILVRKSSLIYCGTDSLVLTEYTGNSEVTQQFSTPLGTKAIAPFRTSIFENTTSPGKTLKSLPVIVLRGTGKRGSIDPSNRIVSRVTKEFEDILVPIDSSLLSITSPRGFRAFDGQLHLIFSWAPTFHNVKSRKKTEKTLGSFSILAIKLLQPH
jgi:hypothetical protein